MTTIQRVAAVVIASLATACARGAEAPAFPVTPLPQLPAWLQSNDVAYLADGAPVVLPIPVTDDLELTTGVVIRNSSDQDLHIESFEIAGSEGLSATPEAVVIGPRPLSVISPLVGWPLAHVDWGPTAEHPFGPFDLSASEGGSRPEVQVLIRIEIEEPFGYIEGYWIRGTQGGEPFVDFSETLTAICIDGDVTYEQCKAYDAEHSREGAEE